MSLKNSDLQYYDGNILRLSSEKRKEYHAQVDNLIAELRKHITVNSDLKGLCCTNLSVKAFSAI